MYYYYLLLLLLIIIYYYYYSYILLQILCIIMIYYYYALLIVIIVIIIIYYYYKHRFLIFCFHNRHVGFHLNLNFYKDNIPISFFQPVKNDTLLLCGEFVHSDQRKTHRERESLREREKEKERQRERERGISTLFQTPCLLSKYTKNDFTKR